ncbi:MAG: nuclear transport factor 2 family protein [Terracidiphilus sp.]|nr:nuclear transport factor 2 family protein [Terracidiphilus sp.]
MKPASRLLLALLLLLPAALRAQAPAVPPAPANDEAAIRAVLTAQVDAWNRGDIPAFMQSYEDSPDTTFIGQSVGKGYQPILQRYQKSYSTREQMGTLTFSGLDVRLLPSACGRAEIALVTGRFHLQRTTHGEAAKDDGIFSLVWRKGPHGWKIILDHTA